MCESMLGVCSIDERKGLDSCLHVLRAAIVVCNSVCVCVCVCVCLDVPFNDAAHVLCRSRNRETLFSKKRTSGDERC